MKRLAIFDVDGTIFNGNLGIEFLKSLLQLNLFPEELGSGIMSWYSKYKNNEVDKGIAVDEIYKLYVEGMKGLECSITNKVAIDTFNRIKEKIFPFTEELIQILSKNNFLILFISGSPIEMVKQLAGFLGLKSENIIAGELAVHENRYTGEIVSYPCDAQSKIDALDKFITLNDLNVELKNSFAFGDNERDLLILKKVGHGFAINPNESLITELQQNEITVVNENNILQTINDFLDR